MGELARAGRLQVFSFEPLLSLLVKEYCPSSVGIFSYSKNLLNQLKLKQNQVYIHTILTTCYAILVSFTGLGAVRTDAQLQFFLLEVLTLVKNQCKNGLDLFY